MGVDLSPPWDARMHDTVALSLQQVHRGGIPFAAMVIDARGTVLGRGVNRVREHLDPTAHAEVEAIRQACRRAGAPRLPGTILLSSGEPCALCYLATLHAGIPRLRFAVDRTEAAAHGFDYRGTYSLFARDPREWPALAAAKHAVPQGLEPFLAYRRRRLSP